MKILLLNQDWFQVELREMGHEVVTAGLGEHLDHYLEKPLIHIDTLIQNQLEGETPDIIFIHDNSAPIYVMGLEETPIPVIFYSVDAHHHAELHGHIGKFVDHMLIAQKDYIPGMERESEAKIEWMPLWASRVYEPDEEKEHGAVFVGTLKRKLNPERVDFFEKLEKEVPILCKTGAFWQIFPKSEIVINQTVKGDLNFRVFEAMMSGALLLTEYSENGLLEIFKDKEHLVTYTKNDVHDAAEKIRYYLENKELAKKIGEQGREEIMRSHLPKHRAKYIEEICKKFVGNKQKRERNYLGWMINCNFLATRLATLDTELAREAWVFSIKAAEAALKKGERIDPNNRYSFVHTCSQFDRLFHTNAGFSLLEDAHQQFPEEPLIILALIRNYLNQGRRDQATELAQLIPDRPVEEAFLAAEEIMSELLSNDKDKDLLA